MKQVRRNETPWIKDEPVFVLTYSELVAIRGLIDSDPDRHATEEEWQILADIDSSVEVAPEVWCDDVCNDITGK